MKKQTAIDMCSGPVLGKILMFSLPLMASGILQLLFNAADVMVVGNFCGSVAMAAVGSNGAVINLIVNLFLGISIGTNVLVARSWGRQHADSVFRAVHSSVALSVILGVFTGIFGAVMAPKMLTLLSVPEDVLPLASLYLRIYFIGIPATVVYNFGAAILRAIGNTRQPLYYLSISGALNVLCNIILVIGFKMDVAGVAIASAISQYVATFLVLRYLTKLENACRLSFRMLRLYRYETLEMIRIGIPAGLQSTVFSISNVLIQSAINAFGAAAIAGNVAAMNIDNIIYIALNAIHHAAVSFISQNLGAGKLDRIVRIARSCLLMTLAIGGVMCVVTLLAGESLLTIFNREPDVIAAGMVRIRNAGAFYFLCGLMEVSCGIVRGMGSSWLPMIVSMVGVCGIRIVWIYTIFAAFPTLQVLYISYPVTWIITMLIHLLCAVLVYKRLKLRHAPKSKTQMPEFTHESAK